MFCLNPLAIFERVVTIAKIQMLYQLPFVYWQNKDTTDWLIEKCIPIREDLHKLEFHPFIKYHKLRIITFKKVALFSAKDHCSLTVLPLLFCTKCVWNWVFHQKFVIHISHNCDKEEMEGGGLVELRSLKCVLALKH